MESASKQLALALFEDLGAQGDGVDKAPVDLGFRRNNDFIKIVDLSLAARRLVDVVYFLVAEDSELRKEYRVDYQLFKWLMGTTSNNRRHVAKLIREAQKAAIELNEVDLEDSSKDRWGAVPLLGAAYIANGEFSFELTERLQAAIKNPTASHFLSLRFIFKSIHSKVLYDRLQPYVPSGLTPWLDLAALRVWLDCEKKTYDAWKHFRSKVLDAAIAEVREVTGLRIEMVTMNVPGSKRVAQVRFRVSQSTQPDDQKLTLLVLKTLYETLRTEFALTQNEFNEILASRQQYTDERIHQAMDYTRHQVALGKVRLRAGGYFMKALREGYLVGELDKRIHQGALAFTAEPAAPVVTAQELQQRYDEQVREKDAETAAKGWALYEALSEPERAEVVASYCGSRGARLLAKVNKIPADAIADHLDHPTLRRSLSVFMFMRDVEAKRDLARTASAARKPKPL